MRYIENLWFLIQFIQIWGQFGFLPEFMLRDNRMAVLIFCVPAIVLEGMRVCQVPACITSVLFAILGFVLNTNNIVCGLTNLCAFCISMYIRWMWGPGDFSRV